MPASRSLRPNRMHNNGLIKIKSYQKYPFSIFGRVTSLIDHGKTIDTVCLDFQQKHSMCTIAVQKITKYKLGFTAVREQAG